MDQHIWTKPRIRRIEPGEILRNFPVSFSSHTLDGSEIRRWPAEVGSLSHAYPMIFTVRFDRSQEVLSRTTINQYQNQVTKIWWIFVYLSKACLAFQLSICPFLFTSIVGLGRWLVGHCTRESHEWFCWETGEKKHPHMLKCDENCFFVVILWVLCRGITGSQQKASFFLSTWPTGIFSNAMFRITRIHQSPIGWFMKITLAKCHA